MASDVDICNLALGRLGDDAEVTSINPPDNSAQAGHCQRFYPIARDSLLQGYGWGFATRRVTLTPSTVSAPEWAYSYALPNNVLDVQAVYDPSAPDDINFGLPQYYDAAAPFNNVTLAGTGVLTPQNFVCETDPNGNSILYTNQSAATARCTFRITDTTKFSPLFVDALAWLLASYLAGPVLKGEAGAGMAMSCLKAFAVAESKATLADARMRRQQANQQVTAQWMVNR